MQENQALLLLSAVPFLGPVKIKRLVYYFGSAAAALSASKLEIAQVPGITEKSLNHWDQRFEALESSKNLALLKKLNTHLIAYRDPDYPQQLLEIKDFPLLLYVQGKVKPLLSSNCIAIIGTRNASLYGLEMAKKIGQELAAAGFTVVSGLARGIDTAAHQGAIKAGSTLAVLGCGLSHIYPLENRSLATEITHQGALISELPMQMPPDRTHFPRRNRIVSGLSQATLLIEAPLKSGAMLTMDHALHQQRLLFALPGRADLENFRGNHHLVKTKKAHLIENSHDILEFFPSQKNFLPLSSFSALDFSFSPEEQQLIQLLPCHELCIEEIFQRAHFSMARLTSLLMGLVLKKAVIEFPGKIYKKI